MRTQYYCAASLDGFIADPDDSLDWLTGYEGSFDGEAAAPSPLAEGGSYQGFYAGVSALVSGSVTYEWVLEHGGAWPYDGRPYWVMTTRELPVPEAEGADVRFFDGDAAQLHAEVAATAGEGNLWIVGGGGIASQFAEAGLLDDVLLTVVPVVLGAGKPLFDRRLAGALRLRGTTTFANGMVELRYDASAG